MECVNPYAQMSYVVAPLASLPFCAARGKIRYVNRSEAVRAMVGKKSRVNVSGKGIDALVAYPCAACSGFHLGRSKERA